MILALLRSSITRITAVGMMLLALQNTIFADMRPAGVALQVMLAFAAAAGAAGGSERGASAGFILGLMFDLGTGGPLGASSITMGLAGYVAGYVALINIERQWWLAAIFVAFGSAVGELGVPVVRSFIGDANVYSDRLYIIVPLVAFAAAVASPLLVPVSRWCLRLGTTEWKAPPE
jgi:rod shape-determining protein MreD